MRTATRTYRWRCRARRTAASLAAGTALFAVQRARLAVPECRIVWGAPRIHGEILKPRGSTSLQATVALLAQTEFPHPTRRALELKSEPRIACSHAEHRREGEMEDE